MYLGNFIKNLNKKYHKIYFSGLAFDSKKVKKNNIFFAIKGNKFDGNKYILDAINKGAKIIISEKDIKLNDKNILFLRYDNPRKLLAKISYKLIKNKPKNLIAVTGTNGKSSVANFYYQILTLNNKKAATIGTLGVCSKKINVDLSNTTVDPIHLGQILRKLKNYKINNVIMEASSHGLVQNRLDGLIFNSGIFTNLSQDHLDYHKNLKDYLKAKLYLFQSLIRKKGNIITDSNIPEFTQIKKIAKKKFLKLNTIDSKNKNLKILKHSFQNESQILQIKYGNIIKDIKLNLIGKIQIKNILMALIAAEKSGLNLEKILKVLPNLKPVNGRFEKIGIIKNKSKVILDYAHTPDALKTCLVNLKEQFSDKKVILLFGCGGNRDQNKRSKMGKIADIYSDEIYLTDDNPRFENPNKIRKDIRIGIKQTKVTEISNRAKAITTAIRNLRTGEILLVAGKGHEKIQDIGKGKIFFSDKKIILDSIKIKNLTLSNNLKLNIIKEVSGCRNLAFSFKSKKARINSREVKKDDIFFAIKGKINDGNKFVRQSFENKASLAIVNRIDKNLNVHRQIKIQNTLKFLTDVAKIFRKNINTRIIAITGSCGKTSLKELLGTSLNNISQVSISPKSYNNRFGVPLSLLNLNSSDNYGVLEVGMDKKGEIDNLSKIIKPNVSVITNINYAHAKNFKNIKSIALAKSEIIHNTKPKGCIVLNADDSFFKFHKTIALKKKLRVISFGIKNKKSTISLSDINRNGKYFLINIEYNNLKKSFLISNNFQSNIYNVLGAIAVISIYFNISELNKKIFLNFKTPKGRGDISRIKIMKKHINLIDESYNSNPLSLKSAILNFEKINSKKSKKFLLIGDMLELGKHSKRLHKSIAPIINKTKINKVFVKGNNAKLIFQNLSKSKKGKVLHNKSQIIELLRKDLNDNDYLMIKASNATGFNLIVKEIKGIK
tara:strand:+ start:972 stop:3815 length:2844 start_codon:yes stop_codon:yes gene_type:complete